MLPTYLVKPLYWPVKLKTTDEIKVLRISKLKKSLKNNSKETFPVICRIVISRAQLTRIISIAKIIILLLKIKFIEKYIKFLRFSKLIFYHTWPTEIRLIKIEKILTLGL